MHFEFAPEEYRVVCTYTESLLYCFQLEIDGKSGWRLPSLDEYLKFFPIGLISWRLEKGSSENSFRMLCVPVRDI